MTHRTQTPRTLEQIGPDEARFWLKTLASCGITPESLVAFARALDAESDAEEMRDEAPEWSSTTAFDIISRNKAVCSEFATEEVLEDLEQTERAARVLGIDATGGMEDEQ